MNITASLEQYEKERRLRVAVIYGLARMAANMASTYRPYLGVGLGPFSFLTKFKIPHPGRIGGRLVINYVMPLMLSWVLGGNRADEDHEYALTETYKFRLGKSLSQAENYVLQISIKDGEGVS
ncbi:zeaxanthin epoxidase, chloroplastic-like [Phalaenopsis equestris]|uniref:zeaxanthin epoxidase, chloroplastic-like n=1 Tax=Phalaenopsis equestris TaxID=78828 RepID=UPI0009E62EEB|nr:zeaxanthin epoxidase, chloroplastic-like [Phalaenopsis equestris]